MAFHELLITWNYLGDAVFSIVMHTDTIVSITFDKTYHFKLIWICFHTIACSKPRDNNYSVTRMRAWVELSRYRIWLMILGERSVADLGCGWSGDK